MSVSNRMREIEKEIDESIRNLPIWQASRAEVLDDIMRTYRDAIEVSFLHVLDAKAFDGTPEDFGAAFGQENRFRAGALWALKWASEFCPSASARIDRTSKELVDLLSLGAIYETFVDALKYAQHNLITIKVDETTKTITFFEGGPATEFDALIVDYERLTTPLRPHISLTDDCDQLTSRWTAGDYRRLTKQLSARAAHEEKETILIDPALLAQLGRPKVSFPRPTIVWIERPAIAPDCYVFDDLVLPDGINAKLKWRLVALLDSPIVQVGNRFCALTSDIKTIARIDDYMLRLAARVDPDQYSTASTLRENRMINICRDVFEQCASPWSVEDRVLVKDPPQEVDILARSHANTLVLQLKSTLRPETPWEVYKRNEDIIKGIKHTRRLIDRNVAGQGFVVTDGYRGDFSCWAESLATGVPIATLFDLEVIASNPVTAIKEVKSRVGITNSVPESPPGVPDREKSLMGWTLRFVDKIPPTV